MTVKVSEKLFVLCGNYREFEMFCHENMVSKQNAVYVTELHHIRGHRFRPFQVIHYGSWHTIRNLSDIDQYLRMVYDMCDERPANASREIPAGTGTPARPAGKRAPAPGKP